MIISTKYRVSFTASQLDFLFNSLLEAKDFLKNVSSVNSGITAIRIYKVVFTLDTSTHYVSKVETEVTSW